MQALKKAIQANPDFHPQAKVYAIEVLEWIAHGDLLPLPILTYGPDNGICFQWTDLYLECWDDCILITAPSRSVCWEHELEGDGLGPVFKQLEQLN